MRGPTAAAATRAGRDRLAGVPDALWLVLALAILLRIAVWAAYSPAVVNLNDSRAYVGAAGGDLFGDATRTVGYPLFLRAVHSVSDQIELTIFVQHLLGVVGGLLLYATVRRLGAPVWVGVVASLGMLLSIDQIFLEHALMNETLFTVLVAGAAYAAIRAQDCLPAIGPPLTKQHGWIAAASALLALAAWARPVGLLIVPLLPLWVAFAIPGSWRIRAQNGAIALATAVAMLTAYGALQAAETGEFGFLRSSGWAIYSRAAPFADCSKFEPPANTRPLCETTPVADRPGPDFYGQAPDSPARILFDKPPFGDESLKAFGRRAIAAQPLDYAKAVGRDLVRYFDPQFDPQDFSGAAYDILAIDRRAGALESEIGFALNGYYDDDTFVIDDDATAILGDIQAVVRVHPKLLLGSLILALCGLVLANGRLRWGIALLLALGCAMMLIPPLTAIWNSRYAVPAQGFLLASGMLGLWLVVIRLRGSPRARAASN